MATPLSLVLSQRGTQRPIEPVCPALAWVSEPLNAASAAHYAQTGSGAWGSDLAVSGGSFTGTYSAGAPTAAQIGASVSVGSAGAGEVRVGFANGGDLVAARWTATTIYLTTQAGDRASLAIARPAGSFDLALCISWRYAHCWYRTSGGTWTYATSAMHGFGPMGAAAISSWRAFFGVTASSVWHLSGFAAGPWGQGGVRDQAIVVNKDGSRYDLGDGYVYFTATCAGPVWDSEHMGVFREIETGGPMEKIGQVFTRDYRPDHAGHLMWDGAAWQLITSAWSDPMLSGFDYATVIYGAVSGNPLAGVAVAPTVSTLRSVPSYDPNLAWVGTKWRLVCCDYGDSGYQGIAMLEGPTIGSLADVHGPDGTRGFTEGPKNLLFDGSWYVIGGAGTSFNVWDASLSYLGSLAYPAPSPLANPPHPTLYRVAGGWRMLAFDGAAIGSGGYGMGAQVEYGSWLTISAVVSGSTAAVSGYRASGATVTVSAPGASAGAVTYPDATSWAATISNLPAGTTAITASSGAETASVSVSVGANTAAGSLSLAVGMALDAVFAQSYWMARNPKMGLSWVAGPYALIPYPLGGLVFDATHGFGADASAGFVGSVSLSAALALASDAVSTQTAAQAFAQALGFGSDATLQGTHPTADQTLALTLVLASDAFVSPVAAQDFAQALSLAVSADYTSPLGSTGDASFTSALAFAQDGSYRGPDLVGDAVVSALLGFDSDSRFGPRYDADESFDVAAGFDADAVFAGQVPIIYPPIIAELPDLTLICELDDLTVMRELPDLTFVADSAEDSLP